MPPMVVGTWGTTQANHCYAERISKEEERMKQRPVRPDPFENSLSTLLSQVHLDARLGHNESGGKAASELSRASKGSRARGGPAPPSEGSRASRASQRSAAAAAPAAADARSQLSVRSSRASALSQRTPSLIRSSEPSAIARNKIAELQLRVELERVARLEREHELELQRRERLAAQVAETSAAKKWGPHELGGHDADARMMWEATAAVAGKEGGGGAVPKLDAAPGKRDQIAFLG